MKCTFETIAHINHGNRFEVCTFIFLLKISLDADAKERASSIGGSVSFSQSRWRLLLTTEKLTERRDECHV